MFTREVYALFVACEFHVVERNMTSLVGTRTKLYPTSGNRRSDEMDMDEEEDLTLNGSNSNVFLNDFDQLLDLPLNVLVSSVR